MTTGPFHIRAAEPSDAQALTELLNLPGVRHGTLQLPFTPLARAEARLSAPSGPSIVGYIDVDAKEKLVAHGGILPGMRRRAHVGEIHLIVHDAYIGQGFGRAIMSALLDMADNWLGLRRLELDVNTDNIAAIKLYQSFGFEIEGTKRGDTLRDGILIDAHVMGRLIDAPNRLPNQTALKTSSKMD